LVAFCRPSAAFKTFAIQRIEKAEVLDEVFDRDPNFDPVRFTELGFGALHGATFEIVIEFDASVAHLARERRWHATQRVDALVDGGVRLTMTAAGLPEVAAWIASFGGKVRAIAPEGLIGAVRAIHEGGIAACGQVGNSD
jgi:predicted DNA-binding transcriptional regulator YafY